MLSIQNKKKQQKKRNKKEEQKENQQKQTHKQSKVCTFHTGCDVGVITQAGAQQHLFLEFHRLLVEEACRAALSNELRMCHLWGEKRSTKILIRFKKEKIHKQQTKHYSMEQQKKLNLFKEEDKKQKN